jgi:hypothetical protein
MIPPPPISVRGSLSPVTTTNFEFGGRLSEEADCLRRPGRKDLGLEAALWADHKARWRDALSAACY